MSRQYVVHSYPTPVLVGETGSNSYALGAVLIGETQSSAAASVLIQVLPKGEYPFHPASIVRGQMSSAFVAARAIGRNVIDGVST